MSRAEDVLHIQLTAMSSTYLTSLARKSSPRSLTLCWTRFICVSKAFFSPRNVINFWTKIHMEKSINYAKIIKYFHFLKILIHVMLFNSNWSKNSHQAKIKKSSHRTWESSPQVYSIIIIYYIIIECFKMAWFCFRKETILTAFSSEILCCLSLAKLRVSASSFIRFVLKKQEKQINWHISHLTLCIRNYFPSFIGFNFPVHQEFRRWC